MVLHGVEELEVIAIAAEPARVAATAVSYVSDHSGSRSQRWQGQQLRGDEDEQSVAFSRANRLRERLGNSQASWGVSSKPSSFASPGHKRRRATRSLKLRLPFAGWEPTSWPPADLIGS